MEYAASSSRGIGDRFESVKRRCTSDSDFGEEFGVLPSCEKEQQAEDSNYLDPSLWKNLPDDLHAWVLQKLPLESLVKFRMVCKKWNAAILSVDFVPPPNLARKCVPMYFHDDVPSTVYNRKRNSWQPMSFSFLETPSSFLSLLVSAGGLLCFKTGIAGELIVCNPITKQSRRIQVPCRIRHDAITQIAGESEVVIYESAHSSRNLKVYHLSTGSFDKEVVVGMVMDHDSSYGSGYKLVVAGVTLSDNSSERTTLVYDSITNSWKKGGEVPRGVRFWRSGKPVSSRGYLYCITYNEQVWRERMDQERPWSVLRYDLEHEKWSEVKIPRRNSILHQLVEHQGRILVVQRRPIDQTQMFTSELREDGEVQPYKVAKMPVELFPDAEKRDQVLGDWCVGQGDRVYIAGVYPENSWLDSIETSSYRPIYVDRSLGFGVLTHNPTDNTWTQLPDLCGRYYPEGLYAFEPSLARVKAANSSGMDAVDYSPGPQLMRIVWGENDSHRQNCP
ncbi:hypothetical protein R1sor_006041 [Riccia sorocarpa]|uniref:F-box domain-containing protein n=1 Tax=Riccia sorocarpa TaxID=122646 RepID=A0ABD3HQM5_9MARC